MKKENIKFSIIVPIYNTDEIYLNECLKSIQTQNYNNFEIILVNDCSFREETIEWIKKIESKKNKNIKIINSETNNGLGESRNIGIKNSSGDVIIFVDSDDWVTKDMLYELAKIDFNQYDIVSFNFCKEKEDGTSIKNTDYIWYAGENILYGGGMSCAKAYAKEFLLENNIFYPKENMHHEDEYYTMLCLRHSPRIYSLNKYFYNYRIDVSTSICHTESSERKFNDIDFLLNKLNLSKKDNMVLRKYYTDCFSMFIFQYLKCDNCKCSNWIKYTRTWRKNRKVAVNMKRKFLYNIAFFFPITLFLLKKIIIKRISTAKTL